ncbi:MAG: hypothetical protein KDD58_04450 [Bdellovibrionales bacterium]|nr:hypothetical protein [Bdellovibrionales bacterium]
MDNLTKTAKFIFAASTCCFLIACDGQVEFDDIPVSAGSLCENGDDCTTNIDTPVVEDGYEIITRKSSVLQEGTGGSVDILVVVDNSYSMFDEQKKMGERFGDFVATLGNIDWQLAFTTTDARNNLSGDRFGGNLLNLKGATGKILNKSTPNLLEVFRNTIDRESDQENCGSSGQDPCGSSIEEPLKAITQVVAKKDSENKSFFRDNSALAVIILTDEDEKSFGSSNATKPEEVINAVKNVFGDRKFVTYGIIIQPGDSRCLAENQPDGVVATHVNSLAMLTGGITRSLCDADYKPSMKEISKKVRKILKFEELDLDFPPVENSVDLKFYPPQNTVNWRTVGNRVVFETAPKDGTRIDYSYKYKIKKSKD